MLRLRRILKVIDLGESDDSSLADCLTLADRFDAELHLLHVVIGHGVPRFGSRKRLEQRDQQFSAPQLSNPNSRVVREVREGTIVECVADYIQQHDIDLVVIDRADVATLGGKAAQSVIDELRDRLSIPILLTSSEKLEFAELAKQAAEKLYDTFGQSLDGEHDPTCRRILNSLQSELELTQETAETLFMELQATGLIQWRSEEGLPDASTGAWQFKRSSGTGASSIIHNPEFELESTPAVSLLQRAIETGATDIHIDPAGQFGYVVQFRVDGRMQEFCRLEHDLAGATMKQIKLMANISLADPFHPCESRLQMPASIQDYEVRITTAPVAGGEAIALRLINCSKLNLPMHELGFSPKCSSAVHRMLHERSGLVLIAGPTGAGKTTTAYSVLHVLFAQRQKIVSIEDPVELVVPFMRQLSVDERHGFSMRNGLSTILRMDPDAVFVGEIRNLEAAHVAFQAAACGKRAFSTIHMRDISATVSAMREFDIDPKTLADNLSGVIAQRLVRRICHHCCQRTRPTPREQEMFAVHNIEVPAELARPRGCPECRGTGYHGRIGIFEAAVVEGQLADAIRAEVHETELRRLIRQQGGCLVADGLLKARDGITTAEELQETSWLVDSLREQSQTYEDNSPASEPLLQRAVRTL